MEKLLLESAHLEYQAKQLLNALSVTADICRFDRNPKAERVFAKAKARHLRRMIHLSAVCTLYLG